MLPFTRLVKKGGRIFWAFCSFRQIFKFFFGKKWTKLKGVSSAEKTKGLSLFSSLLLSNGVGGAVGVGVGRRRRAQLHHSVAELWRQQQQKQQRRREGQGFVSRLIHFSKEMFINDGLSNNFYRIIQRFLMKCHIFVTSLVGL